MVVTQATQTHFYPRSPCGERHFADGIKSTHWIFLSTLSLRRATRSIVYNSASGYFYPRSPCGERRNRADGSIGIINFYPRSPCGERHGIGYIAVINTDISIHALLAESDIPMTERIVAGFEFLSTLSLRRATLKLCKFEVVVVISIHALLAESDPGYYNLSKQQPDFYPRSPCGERRVEWRNKPQVSAISIHALLAESDLIQAMPHLTARLFLSTLSLRRATTTWNHPAHAN